MQLDMFKYDNVAVRTAVVDDKVWFVAKDLAEVLEYSKTQNALDLCKNSNNAQSSQLNKINNLPPATKWIPESDMYRLVMRSTKPEAEKFQDWVVEEVLPTIRKTGSYTLPTPAQSNRAMAVTAIKENMELFALFKVPEHVAQIESVKIAKVETGFDASYALTVSPVQDAVVDNDLMLEPTELGKLLGYTAAQMNMVLFRLGLQTKEPSGWVRTQAGELLSSAHSWFVGTKSGYNYKWRVDAIKSMLPKL